MSTSPSDGGNATGEGAAPPTEHPLSLLFAGLAQSGFPAVDGITEVMPRANGAPAAVLAFTGHCVVAADVDPTWVAAQCPPWQLTAAYSPAFLSALACRVGAQPMALDVLLGAPSQDGESELPLALTDAFDAHPRVRRARRMRTDVRVYQTEDGTGLLAVGRGLAGRWEAGFEVAPEARGQGLGRRLAAAARHLIPPGVYLFAQVAPGNATSLRATLAAGFTPLGSELLFDGV
ncbi:MAG TPA: GNAT family N-acetyltransferase [Ktedonobacterales bacterium]